MESFNEEMSKGPEDRLSVWKQEISAAKKHYEKFWKVSETVLKRYRDERNGEFGAPASRLNFFWSNVQVLKSSLYVKPPKVDVSRIYKDFGDDVARVAGIMLERLLNADIERDGSPFDASVRQAIDDWLITGSGTLWLRFDVETEEVLDPVLGIPVERIADADAPTEFVYWHDFLASPARTWEEVRWVARRVPMTRDALVERFGNSIGKAVPLSSKHSASGSASDDDPWATADVWEIWCKENRRVYWVNEGFGKFLGMKDDPLQLTHFFPCPQPMLANQTNNTLIPRADYSMARDQYQQIDVLVSRIRLLIDACKVAGAYDKDSAGALASILGGAENKMVPIENWALFGERGGIKGVIDWVPIEQIVSVIAQLRQDLAEQKQQLYEVLGISDIMRGATRATETATAQQIKAQFGSTRLQFKQFEIARFVADAQRIRAEIICRHFPPGLIVQRSNIMATPDAQLAGPAVELLKNEAVASYRLSVEPESMAMMDWAAERDARSQFMQSAGAFVQMVTPLAQSMPRAMPLLLQMLQWGLAGFRAGRTIEGAIDQAIQAMQSQPQSPEQAASQQIEQRKRVAEVVEIESKARKNEASARKDNAEIPQQAALTAVEMSDAQLRRAEAMNAMAPAPGAGPLAGSPGYAGG